MRHRLAIIPVVLIAMAAVSCGQADNKIREPEALEGTIEGFRCFARRLTTGLPI